MNNTTRTIKSLVCFYEQNASMKDFYRKVNEKLIDIKDNLSGLDIKFEVHLNIDSIISSIRNSGYKICLVIVSGQIKKRAIQVFSEYGKIRRIIIFGNQIKNFLDEFEFSTKHQLVFNFQELLDYFDLFFSKINVLIWKNEALEENAGNSNEVSEIENTHVFEKCGVLLPNIFLSKVKLKDDDCFEYSICEEINRDYLNPDKVYYLEECLNLIDIGFNPEDDIEKFKTGLIATFKDKSLFKAEKMQIDLIYIRFIENETSIIKILKSLLTMYTMKDLKSDISMFRIINQALRRFDKINIIKLKYILTGLFLNFASVYNPNPKVYKEVYRFTNVENGPENISEGDLLFTNQFFSTIPYNNLDSNILNKRHLAFKIRLSKLENTKMFMNYITVDKYTNSREKEVLFLPFTKFKIVEVSFSGGKRIVEMTQQYDTPIFHCLNDNLYFTLVKNCDHSRNIEFFKNFMKNLQEFKNNTKNYKLLLAKVMVILGSLFSNNKDLISSITYINESQEILKEAYAEDSLYKACIWNNIGKIYENFSEYEKAIDCFQKSIDIKIKIYGSETLLIAESYKNFSYFYEKLSNFTLAIDYYHRFSKIKLKHITMEKELIGSIYEYLASLYSKSGEYQNGLDYYLKSLKIKMQLLGYEDTVDITNLYKKIGMAYCKLSKFETSYEYYLNALKQIKILFGEKDPITIETYDEIGYVYCQGKNYYKAVEFYTKALELRIEKYGIDSVSVVESYVVLGDMYFNMNEMTSAINYLKMSLEIYTKRYGEVSTYTAGIYKKFGFWFYKSEQYEDSLDNYEKALSLTLKIPSSPQGLFTEIAEVHYKMKNYGRAIDFFTKSLENLLKANNGQENVDSAKIYLSLGFCNREQAVYDKALELFMNALNIYLKIFGESTIKEEVLHSYVNIAGIQKEMKEYETSNEYYIKALEIEIKLFGEDTKSVLDFNEKIGDNYHSLKNLPVSLDKYNIALNICTKMNNEESNIKSCSIYNKIAMIYEELGNDEKYFDYLQKLKALQKKIYLGEDNVQSALTYKTIGMKYYKLKNTEKALENLLKAYNTFINTKGYESFITISTQKIIEQIYLQ